VSISTQQAPRAAVDTGRWPDVAVAEGSPVRAAVARALFAQAMAGLPARVQFPDGRLLGGGPPSAPVMVLRRPREFFRRVGASGLIGFGESYMAGDWDCADLTSLLTVLAEHASELVPPWLQRMRALAVRRPPSADQQTRGGARRNIGRHYDLSNDLFATFLDDTMTYSSALFDTPRPAEQTLESAQERKIQRILDIAGVREGSTVLEIGTGWGELALQAAKRGAAVTSVTLSTEQAALARERVRNANLSDRVDIEVQDYRDVKGRFDAIVSVEMIEAVGEKWWPTYFRTLDDRLEPGGRVGLQAIVMPHDRLMASKRSWTWIHKYIFPGGLLLSERVIDEVCAAHTSLRVVDRLHMSSSYAETLRQWRERFTEHTERIAALGFDATFRKMWTFYLAYCEAGFRAGYLNVAQLTLARNPAVTA
jgi:cyclopropane-fatty-acyl-phospholipid synthase